MYRVSHESTTLTFNTFSKIVGNAGYVFHATSSPNMLITYTNFHQLTSNSHETLRLDTDSSGTFINVYFVGGGNSNTGWVYSNGFQTSTFIDCIISDISYTIGKDGTGILDGINATLGVPSVAGAETLEIRHYKSWYMNADLPYSVSRTPERTLPAECPPIYPQAEPRKIRRVVATATQLAGVLSEGF